MSKSLQKLEAVKLRESGMSVKTIAKLLDVSSGSVSIWTRDIILTPLQKARLRKQQIAAGHEGRLKGTQANKEKKQQALLLAEMNAKNSIKILSKKELFFLGLGLYWGEGVKANASSLAIINSDPRVIQVMMRWFFECFGVEKERFMPRVFISDEHSDREEKVITFWVHKLGIPKSQFKKTIFLKKGKKIYENRDIYYGVMALRVAKGTDIKYKILAQIAQSVDVSLLMSA